VTPERWRQVNDLFHAIVERDAPARQQILDRTASTDPELAAEVRSLLAAHDSSDGILLEQPVWAVAPDLILEPETVLQPGTQTGPYRIVREVGRGGMGVVYEAEDTRLRRSVALKALPSQYTRDPIRRERLTREARAAAALAHPAIATIYALDELDGALYLVSELVRGETLREELRRGAIPVDQLIPTLIGLASGLAAAHAAGIVHRDFKPENIVRCGDGRVKILDFGVARMSDKEAVTELRLTQTGMAIGTPGYMAPEQLGGESTDARTDVFAFGVVAWELATGAHPFGASPAELLAKMTDLMNGRPVTAVGASLSVQGLEPILRKCLRRNPADRYASAQQVLEDLERLGTAAAATGRERPASSAMWWWQMHQATMAVVVASMPVASWFLRRWGGSIGSKVFLLVLALATISVTIRLNLLFTSRVHQPQLAKQRARVYAPMAIVETILGLVLLASAALVTEQHDGLAAVLVTLAVATVASLGVIEPATTAAALGSKENAANR
jgi:eukaryotic-like serine/threonine-protein kinase